MKKLIKTTAANSSVKILITISYCIKNELSLPLVEKSFQSWHNWTMNLGSATKWFKKNLLYLAWTQALVATLGSLFFSEIMKFPPCVLCWYQRILMYPLVLVLGVGILKKDKNVHNYVLPMSILGLVIAGYHNLLYYGILPESMAPCVAGISCTIRFFAWFGFVTIPLLSFTAFLIITFLMVVYKRGLSQK